jgi:hypothetical protein
MSLNLTRRSVKGSPLSVTDHDTNLDKLEDGIEARLTQAQGNAAYATAAQGALASTAIQPGNAALSDAREWSAATITQAEAEAGTATTRRAFTAQRVFQAVAAWWAATATATGQALATAANAAAARTTLGLGTAATAATGDFAAAALGVTNGNSHNHDGGDGAQIAYGSLSGLPSLTSLATATAAGGLSVQSGNLVPVGDIKLVVSNKGETASPATNYVETTVQRACTVIGASWELAPSATGSSSSQAMLYARRSGTKTSLLSANASLASSAILTDVSGTLTGTLTLAAGDTLGVDLVAIGTGSSGHIFTITVRYS